MSLLIKTKSTRIGESNMISLEFFCGTTDKDNKPVEPLREAGKLILTVAEWEYAMAVNDLSVEAVTLDDGVDEVLVSLRNSARKG